MAKDSCPSCHTQRSLQPDPVVGSIRDIIRSGEVKELMNKVAQATPGIEASFTGGRKALNNFLHRNRLGYTLMPSHAGYRGPPPDRERKRRCSHIQR